jgi:hypothetical protein
LSSLLIPVVLKQIDDQKFVAEQQFQAELSRQDKILDAQAAVLDSLASTFWDYEGYAADLLYSRDERYGRDEWHQRAIDAYYLESGPVLGKMRAEISTLLRLAPRPNYESFLRLYEEEVLPLDSCLLELMKLEAESSGHLCRPAAWRARGSSSGHPGTHWRPTFSSRTWPIKSIGNSRA